MPCEVNYVPEIHTVVVVGSGKVTSQDAVQANARPAPCSLRIQQPACLLTTRMQLSKCPQLDIHSLPQYSENLTVPKHIKIALVLPTTRYKRRILHSMRQSAGTEAMTARLFTAENQQRSG